MNTAFKRDALTWLLYLMLGYFAFSINVLGPLAPFLRVELAVDYTQTGIFLSAFAAGLVAASLAGRRVQERLGWQPTFWIGGAILAIGTGLLMIAQSFGMAASATLLMGSGGGLFFGYISPALSAHHPTASLRVLTESAVVASVGSLLPPLLLNIGVGNGWDWRWTLAAGLFVFVVVWVRFRHIQVPQPHHQRPAATSKRTLGKAYWLRWAGLFAASAIEFCLLYWVSDYLLVRQRLDAASVTLGVSLLMAGLLAGRIVGSGLSQRLSGQQLFGLSVGCLGLGLVLVTPHPNTLIVVYIGLISIGAGIANLYTIAAAMLLRVAEQDGRTGSHITLASGLSILTMPILLGAVADRVGIMTAFPLVNTLLITLACGLALSGNSSERASSAHPSG